MGHRCGLAVSTGSIRSLYRSFSTLARHSELWDQMHIYDLLRMHTYQPDNPRRSHAVRTSSMLRFQCRISDPHSRCHTGDHREIMSGLLSHLTSGEWNITMDILCYSIPNSLTHTKQVTRLPRHRAQLVFQCATLDLQLLPKCPPCGLYQLAETTRLASRIYPGTLS